MFCGKCGIDNEEGFQFCKQCGAEMVDNLSSGMNVPGANSNYSQQDAGNKFLEQEIFNYIPLRENEQVLAVTTSNNDAVDKFNKIKIASIIGFLIYYFFFFPGYIYEKTIDILGSIIIRPIINFMESDIDYMVYFRLSQMFYNTFVVLIILFSVFMFFKIKKTYSKNQILIVTDQRLIGKSCGSANEFEGNETLFNLELSNNYTETKSKCFGEVDYTINVGDKKIIFYALNNLDEILSVINEARSYI